MKSGIPICQRPYNCVSFSVNDEQLRVYHCATCGQPNETFIDPSAGMKQVVIEDCSVCCRPNVLKIRTDPETSEIFIEVEFEG